MEGFSIPEIITQFGFAGLIFVAFMFLLKWVLRTQETVLADAKEERASWQTIMSNYQRSLEATSIQAAEFHKQVTEAHGYQREEHGKVLEGLSKLCVVAQTNSDCLTKIKDNLAEQGQALARINGFKH